MSQHSSDDGAPKAYLPSDTPAEAGLKEKLSKALKRIAELESELAVARGDAAAAGDTTGSKRQAKEAATSVNASKKAKMDPSEAHSNIESAIPDDLVPSILEFLDPGIDWPSCRLVSKLWHTSVLSIDKKPGVWIGPLQIHNREDWNERLHADLDNVIPTPVAEREQLLSEQLEEEGHDDLDWYHSWRRCDVELNELGFAELDDWMTCPSLVSATIPFRIRNFRKFIEERRGESFSIATNLGVSDEFSFAGACWCVCVTIMYVDAAQGPSLDIHLERLYNTGALDTRRSDATNFGIGEDIPCIVRYRCHFTSGGKTFRAGDLSQKRRGVRNEAVLDPSCSTFSGGYLSESIPMAVAEFATNPSSPDLDILLELECLGYAYDSD